MVKSDYDWTVVEPAHVKRWGRALSALTEIVDPLQRLDAARQVREEVERLELDAMTAARAAGRTWSDIGALYGLSKQGAQQRFKRSDPARRGRPRPADPTP